MSVCAAHWSPTSHWAPVVQAESPNDSAPAFPLGPHVAAQVAPTPAQTLEQPRKTIVLQSVRNGPPALWHEPPVHVCVLLQVWQVAPPLPHAPVLVPAAQVLPLQHPVHVVGSHTHAPPEHFCPVPHVPVVQVPPQPSLPPHATPVQFGVHPEHTPPEQVPLTAHFAQVDPSWPHAVVDVPPRQVDPEQQPLHDVGSQTHAPPSQCWPMPHVPVAHVPLHPSDAPHALPVHDGVQVPSPQMFGPPAPHVSPAGHALQSMTVPQRPFRWPQ